MCLSDCVNAEADLRMRCSHADAAFIYNDERRPFLYFFYEMNPGTAKSRT